MSSTILVTGGAGYIGSLVAYELIADGHDVVVVDNLSSGIRDSVPHGAIFYETDIANSPQLDEILNRHRPGTVIHLAASISVEESVLNPSAYYDNNFVKSLDLLNACLRRKVRNFVYSSTAAVYGAPETAIVDEQAPTRPSSPYGRSKLMFEWALKDIALRSDLRYLTLRYFNVAGAHTKLLKGQYSLHSSHLIKSAVEAACGYRDSVTIFGTDYPTPDGTGVRDYIHVEDLARAHVDALNYLNSGGASQTLNCGYGRGYSVKEVLDVVKRASETDFSVRSGPRRVGDIPVVVADGQMARKILNWTPRLDDVEAIVRSSLLWERKRPEWIQLMKHRGT